MAHDDDIQRTSDTPNDQRVQNSLHFKGSKDQTSPTFQQLLQRDGSKWSRISSQIKKIEDDENRHNKMSVLAKVKQKVKKWKISIRRKKHNDTNETWCSVTRSSGVGPNDKGEEGAEYHSARMYDSKQTPGTNKQALVSTSWKNLENLNTKQRKDSSVAAATKNQAAATTDVPQVHEFSQRNSRLSGLILSTLESSETKSDRSVQDGENMKDKAQTPDKGVVSVKDYLRHKFEPGEDERALSKVITQTISPRRDKRRDAMSSFLNNEESSNVNSRNVHNNVNLDFKSKSLPTSTNLNTNTSSKITPIKQSYSLGSNASKASLNLNQTFKSTFASYQDHFFGGSSSNNNKILNYSSTSSSTNINSGSNDPAPNADFETLAPSQGQGLDSGAKKTRVSGRSATSVRRVPVSLAIQKRVPIDTQPTNVNSVSCI